jgi:hypothetical protein
VSERRVDRRPSRDAEVVIGDPFHDVAPGATPGRDVQRKVGVPAHDLDGVARRERVQGPRDQDVGTAVEAEVVKVDTHRR